jgi:hypothetical protein
LGLNAFTTMISLLDNLPKPEISKQDYEVFCKEYIFDQLKGKKFGRAFCEKFKVKDAVIRCLVDEDIAREMIEETYIK